MGGGDPNVVSDHEMGAQMTANLAEIFTSEDTVWVANEQFVEGPPATTPDDHDYVNVNVSEGLSEEPVFHSSETGAPIDEVTPLGHDQEMAGAASAQDLTSHASAQVDLPDCTALPLPDSATTTSLFKVMEIVSDKQELSFVEKVHIPDHQVLSLCNRLLPNSAEGPTEFQHIRIDFTSLDKLSLPAIGFYGDKQMMVRIFKDAGIVDDSALLEMTEGRFEPGLYVSLLKQMIIVFYWHQGDHLKVASRKDVSCNFIRYVVDLCDNVYVCVEEHDIVQALGVTVASSGPKQRRTQRLKMSHVQNSENDVKIFPGFTVNIARAITTPPTEGIAKPKHELFFAEGYYRCAFVSASYKQSRKFLKKDTKKLKPDTLGSALNQWSKEYDLDFSGLSSKDFVCLLKHSQLPEHQAYCDMMNSIKARRESNRDCNLQFELNEAEDKISKIFVRVLPEYCGLIRYLSNSGSERGEDYSPKEIRTEFCRFQQLEEQLAAIWNGKSGEQKLLFVGSEVKIHHESWKDCSFVIERPTKSTGPILYGEELVLKNTVRNDETHKVTFLPLNKNAAVKEGLVMSGIDLLLKSGNRNSYSECALEISRVSYSVLREWIESLVPTILQNLERNITFLGFLMSTDVLHHFKSFTGDVIEKLVMTDEKSTEKQLLLAALMSDEDFDQIKSFNTADLEKFLTTGNLDCISAEIESMKGMLSQEAHSSISQWQAMLSEFRLDETSSSVIFSIGNWKDLCLSIYKDGEAGFEANVLAMIRKELLPWLQKKLESQKLEAEKLREQHYKMEEENFLFETKKNLSKSTGMQRRMHLQSCVESQFLRTRYFKSLTMEISSEEQDKPSIQWKIVELAPKKMDLDELNLNSMHGITPSCSNIYDLLCCDPEIEDLTKVVLLKSGELLTFVHDKEQHSLNLHMFPKIGTQTQGSNPVSIFRRGFDLVAFDEGTRFLALYDSQVSKVRIYRFDETFRHADWTGIEVMLELFSGSTNITWMECIPGKPEIILADDTNRVRVLELHQSPLMKPKHISLSSSLLKSCISGDGSFLFVIQKSLQTSDHSQEECRQAITQSSDITPGFELKVYMLGDTMSFLKNIYLDIEVEDVEHLQVKVVYFGCQTHLVVYSDGEPGSMSSSVLKIVSATEVLECHELAKRNSISKKNDEDAMHQDCQKSCASLHYIYHIFDKFAVRPALFRRLVRDLNIQVLLKSRENLAVEISQRKCEEYLKLLVGQLEQHKGKEFSNVSIQFLVHTFETWDLNGIDVLLSACWQKPMGSWIRQLICLVPIQITRAENNGLRPLVDGLQIPPHMTYADSISLANLMHFGLYDAVLCHWEGNIKVLSSMGKQSSGKSYLLNHLSGSLLDVAGGRCPDGVWMTVRLDEKCLYVLMDFEGLGSFERTEQEDMLLSVLNAALSNLTIFNKKDFHLDKETEAVFHRFQDGVSLVKNDDKLFRGLFYIAIKDVDVSDVEDLKDEFRMKLLQICKRSRENFIMKMYGGEVEIAAMPSFTHREYHQESLSDIASTVEELDHSYDSGRLFLRDLKLVIAQIAAKDWTPVDLKRVAMRVDILRRNLDSAVKIGCLNVSGVNNVLVNFDTQEEIIDAPIHFGGISLDLQDTGLELATLEESISSNDKVLSRLRSRLESFMERGDSNGDLWHSTFENFLRALADRRHDRVQTWLRSNTAEFTGSNDVQKLQLEAGAALAELKQGLSLCGCKCSVCFWRCVLEKGHSSFHSCMGNHVCTEKCTYCSLEIQLQSEVKECQNLAGHEGLHDCKRRNHTCAKNCYLFDRSSNCSKSCCLKVGHEGSHKCNSPQHMCKMKCSLSSCKNPCVMPIEFGDHEKHACHERYCPKQCIMDGCPRICGYQDHFHELTSDEHLCGNEHPCHEKCEAAGICEISTELVRQTRSFQGRRGSFEYEHVSEQNGLRKDCCISIPPFKRSHDGLHVHTQNPDAVHYCMVKCDACGYYCQRPMFHLGLHNTVHGNMRNVNFTSDREEFDIQDRKYTWGESGLAEMCNMHCKAQGRGHIHLIRCPVNDNLHCTSHMYDGSRHETRKYGPDVDVAKDELTHETYWKCMRFEDPCSEEDQREFALCNHFCRSKEHNEIDGTSSRSYCTEKLWHAPLKRNGLTASSAGYITDDGHKFACEHSKEILHHVVFVIDKSGSMGSPDVKPTMTKFMRMHNCRLGCVYEAIVRFIRTRLRTTCDDSLSVILFDNAAVFALEMQDMKEDRLEGLLSYVASGGTSYSSGLKLAENLIIRGSKDPNVNKKKPTIIFLSDGGNNDWNNPFDDVNRMKQQEPRMVLHTIMFGRDPTIEILRKMAEIGNGSFQHSLDEVQLARSFENLATSLKPDVAALI